MKPTQALDSLAMLAGSSRYQPAVNQIYLYKKIILDAMTVEDNSAAIKEMQAQNTELTIRVAELEDELAEARAPKRRGRKKADG